MRVSRAAGGRDRGRRAALAKRGKDFCGGFEEAGVGLCSPSCKSHVRKMHYTETRGDVTSTWDIMWGKEAEHATEWKAIGSN